MNSLALKNGLVKICAFLIVAIIVLIPFHAFLTVWGDSLIGHYTLLRLWKEFLLVFCLVIATFIFFTDRKVRNTIAGSYLFWLIMFFLAVQVIWGLIARSHGLVNKKALAYGLLLDCRYTIFFLVVWAISLKTLALNKLSLKIILWPAVIVVAFGLLQVFILPRNFLSHFGYNLNTIPAYATINHNSGYIRIESTLRGANPLGAYLIIPISLLTALIIQGKKSWQKVTLLIGTVVVLIFSFSRSAWIGTILAVVIAAYGSLKSKVLKKTSLYVLALSIVLLGVFAYGYRNNLRVENIIWHTQTHSASKVSSDQAHNSALRTGIKQVLTNPLGQGPGSAGPASIYNNHPDRIAENYYVQIGQETGWVGLALFVAIIIYTGLQLLVRRNHILALALLASLAGICFVNILSHAWTDDTLAYLWWGLAGIAITLPPKTNKAS